ncbi:MAG: OB-fold nucleic acid binding domain-containing protein [Ilumatobacteraceae bacterium]
MEKRSMRARLGASMADLERTRLQDRFKGLGLTPLGELTLRVPVRVAGEVTRVVLTPRRGVPNLEVMIHDGSGSIVAIFTGRRAIPGLAHGRATIFEGVAMEDRDRTVVYNPAYTLVA